MRKLAEETYEYEEGDWRRTLWFNLSEALTKKLFAPANKWGGRDLMLEHFSFFVEILTAQVYENAHEETHATEMQWVFYTPVVMEDAMGDAVRFSIMLRLRNGVYTGSFNMSDYYFASSFDEIEQLKAMILERLNAD